MTRSDATAATRPVRAPGGNGLVRGSRSRPALSPAVLGGSHALSRSGPRSCLILRILQAASAHLCLEDRLSDGRLLRRCSPLLLPARMPKTLEQEELMFTLNVKTPCAGA